MAPDVVGGGVVASKGKNGGTSSLSSSSSRRGHNNLKKGPWTAAEDGILIEYVKKHGEGNWNAVQRNSGLMRCGKSCRLRWANHLRPNLKKGAFSADEEALIVQLHAKLGNKWARMAAQLPGRTDNEIKNYWNTRLKRRQRAGLPIYPHDVNVKTSSSTAAALIVSDPQPQPLTLNPGYSTPLSLFDIFDTMKPIQQQQRKATTTTTAASNIIIPNQHFNRGLQSNYSLTTTLLPSSSIQYNCMTTTTTPPVSGLSFEQNGVVSGTGGGSRGGGMELPSIQSSSITTDHYVDDADGHDQTANQGFSGGNSTGLLEDLIDESHQVLTRANEKSKVIGFPMEQPKIQENYLWDYKVMEGLNFNQDNLVMQEKQNIQQDSTYAYNSSSIIRAKTTNNNTSCEATNQVDDDFLSLLEDNVPLTNNVQMPDLYDHGSIHNEQLPSIAATSEEATITKRNHHEQEPSNNSGHDFDIGSCYWKNMPGIFQM